MPAPRTAPTPPRLRLEFAQKAFILKGNHLLLVRKTAADPHHPGRWEVPGGRLEVTADPDLDDHIRREVWEEVGLKVEPGPPFHLWQWYMPGERAQIRVVAAARVCVPLSLDLSVAHQTPTDHLAEPTWVPFGEVGGFELIPSLRPVMRAFLRLHAG